MTSNFPIIINEEEFKSSNPGSYRDMWTEITIQAPPAKVRSIFLDFPNRTNWDPFYRHMEVKKGQLEDLSTKPTLSITVDMKGDGKNFKVPFAFPISRNDEQYVIWGLNKLCGVLFLIDHVHAFLPVDDGKATRFVNYERQSGCMKILTNVATITKAFNASNEALKKVCEEGN
jgi:hypothetical protein